MEKRKEDFKRVRIYLYGIFPYWCYYDNDIVFIMGKETKVLKGDVWEDDCLFNSLFRWTVPFFDFFNIFVPSLFGIDVDFYFKVPKISKEILEKYDKKQNN